DAKRETVAVLFAWPGHALGRETKGLVCVPLWWPFSLVIYIYILAAV
ncbi:hypothetical protein HMPREF0083_02167, partial [Aneurinibacillus aneurinilyticus ATCC 12856]